MTKTEWLRRVLKIHAEIVELVESTAREQLKEDGTPTVAWLIHAGVLAAAASTIKMIIDCGYPGDELPPTPVADA